MGTLAVILGFLKANWEIIALGTLVVDKVVAATPCKWDDLLVTGAKAALGAATGRKLKVLLLPLPLCAMLLAACATQTAPAYTPPAPCDGQPHSFWRRCRIRAPRRACLSWRTPPQ